MCKLYGVAHIGLAIVLLSAQILLLPAAAQDDDPAPDAVRAGMTFIETQVYSEEDDARILKLFDGLRTADVSDAMDSVGLQNTGRMSPAIHPLWRDTQTFKHRIVGIAVTVRYVPTQRAPTGDLGPEEYDEWWGEWYGTLSDEKFFPILRKGSVLVIEEAPNIDVGTIGSKNTMSWKLQGCVGVVTDGTARDTDEIAMEGIPLYFRNAARGYPPGRNEIESVNRPVVVGDATVMPGDVILADGDGVLVVPRAKAEAVAKYARGVLDTDKAARGELYEQLGVPKDTTVE